MLALVGSIACDADHGASGHPAMEPSHQTVAASGPGLIQIAPEGPFFERLTVAIVTPQAVAEPALKVTGSVVARLGVGTGPADGRWDFSDPQVATLYADWVRNLAAEPFAMRQAEKTRELAEARVAAQTKVVARLQ